MKRLKYLRLVQFYVFDQIEIEIGKIMGIFGPNGSGKSSALDAIQIANTGADESKQYLNAQANDGKSSKRNIRSYCLGTLGDDRRARDEALTYITEIWEDDETGEVVSNGVCISASADMDRHKVEARYVIQGFDIPLEEHLLRLNGKVHPRPVKDFKRMLQQRGAQLGDDAVLFDSATKYVQALLFALRPSSGVINKESFLRSFVFALAMSFDKSVDDIVRKEVLEHRPLDIVRFKTVTESFRKLKQMVEETETKLSSAEKVNKAFEELADTKSRLGAWRSLSCEAYLEIASEATNVLHFKQTEVEDRLLTLQGKVEACKCTLEEARSRYDEHAAAMSNYEPLQRRTQLEQNLESINYERSSLTDSLRESITLLVHGLDQSLIAVKDCVDLDANALRHSLATLNPLRLDVFSWPAEEAISELSKAEQVLRQSSHALRKQQFAVGQQIDALKGVLKELHNNRGRVMTGKAGLDHNVAKLQRMLADEGIKSTPVCDLIEVSDPTWQIVIETYLGPHLQTLLIDDPKREADAFRIARNRGLYDAKVLLGSREKLDRIHSDGTVASLIQGKSPEAIAYLRRLFGQTKCAESDKEALGSERTLTRDGMLVSSSTFERLKLLEQYELKIGMQNRSDHLARLDQQEHEAKRKLRDANACKDRLGGMIASIAWIEPESWLESVRVAYRRYDKLGLSVEALLEQIAQLSSGEIDVLEQQKRELAEQATNAQDALNDCYRKIGGGEELLLRLKADIVKAQLMEAQRREALINADTNPLIVADWRAQQWDRLYKAHGTDYENILGVCQSKLADATSRERNEEITASRLLGQYVQHYGENLVTDRQSWEACRAWIAGVVLDLRDTKLVEYRTQLEYAYHTSQITFRNDVALAIKQRLDDMSRHMDQLNGALLRCPVFSNGERYRFKRSLRPAHRPLHEFITKIEEFGAQEDLLDGAGEIPEVFRQLLDTSSAPGAGGHATPLDDYREFFDFDIDILHEDAETGRRETVGLLSRRVGSASGGEHRAPLYVIAGAALANAYHLDRKRDGMALIMLDEAFARMDLTNTVATMNFFEDLGLQVLLASPGENMGILDAFMDRYYAIARDNFQVELEGHTISEATRLKFGEDLPAYLLAETEKVACTQLVEVAA